jgi:hypothetical protein
VSIPMRSEGDGVGKRGWLVFRSRIGKIVKSCIARRCGILLRAFAGIFELH